MLHDLTIFVVYIDEKSFLLYMCFYVHMSSNSYLKPKKCSLKQKNNYIITLYTKEGAEKFGFFYFILFFGWFTETWEMTYQVHWTLGWIFGIPFLVRPKLFSTQFILGLAISLFLFHFFNKICVQIFEFIVKVFRFF